MATAGQQQQGIVLASPPTNPDLRLLDSAPDCFERLADGCCFRTTCCSSCDATTILEKQRKNGNFKRADAPTALASRIKVFSALGLWFTAFAFLLVLAIMGTSLFSDAADIVTFSMGMLPVVLPIIPLAVAVHQFSKGRWARRAPGCCCSLGATTFPSIAGSLHNWMVVCSIFATLAWVTTMSVMAAKAGNGAAQYGVGYAYGWCGTGSLANTDYWDMSSNFQGWRSDLKPLFSGSGSPGSGSMPRIMFDELDLDLEMDGSGEDAGERASMRIIDVSEAESDTQTVGAVESQPYRYDIGCDIARYSNLTGYATCGDVDKCVPESYHCDDYYYEYARYRADDDDSWFEEYSAPVWLYVVLFVVQFVAMAVQIGLTLSLQRFKVCMLELGDGSKWRNTNLSVNEAQVLWQQQVSGVADGSCNADGSFDV